jgi:hypothetical protein
VTKPSKQRSAPVFQLALSRVIYIASLLFLIRHSGSIPVSMVSSATKGLATQNKFIQLI